jgi:hypothetical protein
VITIWVGGSIGVFPYLFTEKEGKVFLALPQLTVTDYYLGTTAVAECFGQPIYRGYA